MKFIVSSSVLLKQLQMLGGVLNTVNALPILNNFLFEIANNRLTITASDLETTFSTSIEVETTDSENIAVPARILLDTLKTFPEQPLTFVKTEKNTLEISASNGKYGVAYESGEGFPKAVHVADAKKTTLMGDVLATAINATIFSTSNDEIRPVMTGVFFQFSPEELTFVATDAHRLVKYTRTDIKATDVSEFIMPKKPLQLLKNILQGSEEDVDIEFNETNAQFRFGDSVLTCRLIDGKYPNYEAVIPKENSNVLQIDRVQFLNSVRRTSIFANKTTHQIQLKMAGSSLHISSEDHDFNNSAEERLDSDFRGNDMQIGFNSRFVLEMLNNLNCSEITLSMSDPTRAGIIAPVDNVDEGEHITMLVMPVTITN